VLFSFLTLIFSHFHFAPIAVSIVIKNQLDDTPDLDEPIPLPNIEKAPVMAKVIEFLAWHYEHPTPKTEENREIKSLENILPWDAEFIKVENEMLFLLILAANYLDIKPLLDLGCKTVASMIKGKNAEEIRKTFNLVNDFTPEEEEQVCFFFDYVYMYCSLCVLWFLDSQGKRMVRRQVTNEKRTHLVIRSKLSPLLCSFIFIEKRIIMENVGTDI
jgi:S-phase kinase-associated protein 1